VAVRGRPPKGVARRNVVLRIPKDLLERIKAHQASLEALAGVSIARHDVMLVLLQKGLEACAPPAPLPQPWARRILERGTLRAFPHPHKGVKMPSPTRPSRPSLLRGNSIQRSRCGCLVHTCSPRAFIVPWGRTVRQNRQV
jgi:hypothetical protein